jgi:hypothetical protein
LKKPMLLAKDYPEMEELSKERDESMKFLLKRIENAKEEADKAYREIHTKYWNGIYACLDKNNIEHKGSKGKYSMQNGVLYDVGGGDDDSSCEGMMELKGLDGLFKLIKKLTE